MTTIARFEVVPSQDGNTSTRIASALEALDQHPVSYETTPTDTVIEADDAAQVFAAVQAAHAAIPDDRVVTSLKVDERRDRRQHLGDRVAAVEQALGRPPRRVLQSDQQPAGSPHSTGQHQQPAVQQRPASQQQPAGHQQPVGQQQLPGQQRPTDQQQPIGRHRPASQR